MITNRTYFAVFITAIILLLLPSRCPAKTPASTDGAALPDKSSKISALGRVEPELDVIDLSAAAGEQRIKAVLVKEGQSVTKGQPLVRLVGYAAQKAEVAWLEEKVRTARNQVARELDLRQMLLADAGIRQEQIRAEDAAKIKILAHEIISLEAEVKYQTLEMERAQTLNTKNVVSAHTYDLRQLELVKVRETLNTTKVELERQKILSELHQKELQTEKEIILAESRTRELEIGLKNLEQELFLSKNKLATYTIPSPVEGEILTIFSRAGEVPRTLPILKMADIRTMVVVAEVYETDLLKIHQGQKAVITSPALPGKLTGKVVHISRLIFKRTIKDIDPYQPLDYRVAEVRILLDDPETAARFIQLQVDVELKGTP